MKRFIVTGSVVLAVLVLASSKSSAQVAQWNVLGHGTPFDATLSAASSDANLASVPALSRVGVVGSSAGNSFSSSGWNFGSASLVTNSDYETFTITPAAGFQLNLTSLLFIMCGSNTAPNQDAWGFSSDGGATWSTDPFAVTTSRPTNTWDFADFSTTGSVEFRFWAWGSTGINGGNAASGGTIRIAQDTANNNPELILNGSVTAVPEPSTLTLIGVGLVGMLAFSRRRFSRS